MTGTLRFILGDQLSRDISSLQGWEPGDTIFMCEVAEEATYVKHHKKKIAFLFSAMRHFAKGLKEDGFHVDYVELDDEGNEGSFTGEVMRAMKRHGAERLVVTEPGEWRVRQMMEGWKRDLGVPVEIRVDDRFYCTTHDFSAWAAGRGQLRMEFFYRDMRRKTGILMKNGEPVGEKWNYDHENRESLPDDVKIPPRPQFAADETTRDVLRLVEKRFASHFGELEPFGAPVTRQQALQSLDFFISSCLASFGDYQDAMKQGEPYLFHSLLSALINCGLLSPREVVQAAEAAFEKGTAPLNAVEGFIRQILGWREYVRGIYWLKMPAYKESNFLNAQRPLPRFYYTGETRMNCMRQAIMETRMHAHAHHIQRLMVTGNFAMLAGVRPQDINAWYMEVYWDAYEWVELPNTHGMATFADGGVMASKPYAAGGNYINKMSDYCGNCTYLVSKKNGPRACPFNYLYWDFLARNRQKLEGNPRISRIYSTYDRMSEEKKRAIADDAAGFLSAL